MVLNELALRMHRRTQAPQFKVIEGGFLIEYRDFSLLKESLLPLRDVGFRVKPMKNFPISKVEPREKISQIRKNLEQRFHIKDRFEMLLSRLPGVLKVSVLTTRTTFGPLSLGYPVFERPNLLHKFKDRVLIKKDHSDRTQEALLDKLGVKDIWREFGERGKNCVVAVFDTGFPEGFINKKRVIAEFHGEDVDSVYSQEKEEAHGGMTLMAAAGNEEEGAPFNGVAPDSEILLARVTNKDHELVYIEEAEDWLKSQAEKINKPIVVNKSYGIPLCTGRPRFRFCKDTFADVLLAMQSSPQISEVYAAGNEAEYCGHRLLGFTNAITGHNSLPTAFTIGAQQWDGKIQIYSSHGFGDCAPREAPKPDVVIPIPTITTYGNEVKDMSMGPRKEGSGGGTSHAAPLVAGVIALIRSARPGLSDTEIKRVLYNNSKVPRREPRHSILGVDARFGHGSLDPLGAFKEAVSR